MRKLLVILNAMLRTKISWQTPRARFLHCYPFSHTGRAS